MIFPGRLLPGITLIMVSILLPSCAALYSTYNAPGMEPVLRQEKGDGSISGSIRGVSFLKFNGSYALDRNYSMRGGYTGCQDYDIFNLGLTRIFRTNKNYWFSGLDYSYQSNVAGQVTIGNFVPSPRGTNFNCKYHSVGAAAGINLNARHTRHQFLLKADYNHATHYEASFYFHNNPDQAGTYTVRDLETINYRLRDFGSAELSYILMWDLNPLTLFKFQVSGVYAQKTLEHDYRFFGTRQGITQSNLVEKQKLHPVQTPIYISLGIVCTIPKGSEFFSWVRAAFH